MSHFAWGARCSAVGAPVVLFEAAMEEPEFIVIGRVLAPWGVRGQMKVEPMTDFPERFSPGQVVYFEGSPFSVEKSHQIGRNVILKLATIDTIEESETLRGRFLEVEASSIQPLPPGQYYQFQVQGMEVWTEDGEPLGKVHEILPTGSNDVYVVRGRRGEILVPAIEDVVKEVDPERGRITVHVIEGLLP